MHLCKINRIFAKILENLTVDFSRKTQEIKDADKMERVKEKWIKWKAMK